MELGALARMAWPVRTATTMERPAVGTGAQRSGGAVRLRPRFLHSEPPPSRLARARRSVQADLDDLFTKSKPLRLTADIANIAKHFDLTRPPRAGRQPSFAREYVPGGMGWFGRDGRLVVLSDGEKINVLDLANEAEQAWTAFLREHGCL